MELKITDRHGKTIVIEENHILISTPGLVSAKKKETVIPFQKIVSVDIRKPGALIVGYIRILTSIGENENTTSMFGQLKKMYKASQDKNTVTFADANSYKIAVKMSDHVKARSKSLGM